MSRLLASVLCALALGLSAIAYAGETRNRTADGQKPGEVHAVKPAAVEDDARKPRAFRQADIRAAGHTQYFHLASEQVTRSSSIRPLSFSGDGSLMAAADDRRIALYDFTTGFLLRKLGENDFNHSVKMAALSPGGAIIAVDRYDGAITLWNTETKEKLARLHKKEKSRISALRFSADGKQLLAVSGGLHLWDVASGELEWHLSTGWIDAVFSPDGRKIAIRYPQKVQLWDVATRSLKNEWLPLNSSGNVKAIWFDRSGELIVLWELLGQIHTTGRLYEAVSGRLIRHIPAGIEPPGTGRFLVSPDGAALAIAKQDKIYISESKTGKMIAKLGVPEGHRIASLGFTPDGTYLFFSHVPIRRMESEFGCDPEFMPQPPLTQEATAVERLGALGCSVSEGKDQTRVTVHGKIRTGDGVRVKEFSEEHLAEAIRLMAGFPNLHLQINAVRLNDNDFKRLQHLENLRALTLCNLQATGAEPVSLAGFQQLERITLAGPWVNDQTLKQVGKLSKLERLCIQYSRVTDEGLRHLNGLPNLTELVMGYNGRITDAGASHLGTLTKLQRLVLSQTEITDRGLQDMRGLTSLTKLTLADSRITDDGLRTLAKLPKLKRLDISPIFVTPKSLSLLAAARIKVNSGPYTTRLCDPATGQVLLRARFTPGVFSPTSAGRRLAAVGRGRILDLDTGGEIANLRAAEENRPLDYNFNLAAISPDGKTGATILGFEKATILLLDVVASGTQKTKLTGFDGPIYSVDLLPGNKRLLSFGREVRVWDLATEKTLWKLERNSEFFIRGVLPSRNGEYVAVRYDKLVELRDAETAKLISKWEHNDANRFVRAVCFNDDSALLALEHDYSQQNLVGRVVDMATGRALCQVTAPGTPGDATEFLLSPNGKFLVCEVDDTTYIWDVPTGKLRNKIPSRSWHYARTIRFTPGGNLLLSR